VVMSICNSYGGVNVLVVVVFCAPPGGVFFEIYADFAVMAV